MELAPQWIGPAKIDSFRVIGIWFVPGIEIAVRNSQMRIVFKKMRIHAWRNNEKCESFFPYISCFYIWKLFLLGMTWPVEALKCPFKAIWWSKFQNSPPSAPIKVPPSVATISWFRRIKCESFWKNYFEPCLVFEEFYW